MEFRGRVIQQRFGVGTKSEHDAVMLATDHGVYRLRRVGGNPFRDPELEHLVGREITCDGVLHQGTVLVTSWDAGPTGDSSAKR